MEGLDGFAIWSGIVECGVAGDSCGDLPVRKMANGERESRCDARDARLQGRGVALHAIEQAGAGPESGASRFSIRR